MTDAPPRLSWTQPCCERCWIEQEAEWEDTAPGLGRLVGLRMPSRLIEPVLEQCSWCGEPTIFGVYKRADPTTVTYPAQKADE